MDWKELFGKKILAEVGLVVFRKIGAPAIRAFVKSTSNQWDDLAAANVITLVENLLEDLAADQSETGKVIKEAGGLQAFDAPKKSA